MSTGMPRSQPEAADFAFDCGHILPSIADSFGVRCGINQLRTKSAARGKSPRIRRLRTGEEVSSISLSDKPPPCHFLASLARPEFFVALALSRVQSVAPVRSWALWRWVLRGAAVGKLPTPVNPPILNPHNSSRISGAIFPHQWNQLFPKANATVAVCSQKFILGNVHGSQPPVP
jgi:hypothetical protein